MLYHTQFEHTVWMHVGLTNCDFVHKSIPRRLQLGETHSAPVSAQTDDNRAHTVQWRKIVKMKALLELEGSFNRKLGHIIRVNRIKFDETKAGIIMPLSGVIQYDLKCSAVVLFPIQGEVIDAVVTKVCKGRLIFCYMGLIYGVVAAEHFFFDNDYDYKESVLVGENDVAKMVPTFVSADDPIKVIKKGSVIRLRITHKKFGTTGIWLQGTLNSKYLGLRTESSTSMLSGPISSKAKNSVHEIELTDTDKGFLKLVSL